MASSSSSVNIQAKYDVFLSFRGEDTRHNITSHIYSALIKKGIATFIDDDGLERGDQISPALLKAIEDSMISVIIFSKDYAASRWCLDELAKIIECRNTKGQIVVPVFYHIDPSDVRKQTGSFKKAFVEHEERFEETPERVQNWRAALAQAADLYGYHVMNNRPESKLVDEIVGDILKKLIDKSSLSDDCDDLVGINSRIEKIESLLSNSEVVGVWGMGGLGKTTLAEILFNRISRQFDGCCFIENVREELEKYGGRLVHLQEKIIFRILGEVNHVIDTPNIIPQLIKNRLQRKKVLIVLDDVNDSRILERLIGGLKPLGRESKVIITTRDKQVLWSYGVNNIYEVAKLNYDEALLLFCKHAFKENYPLEHLHQLSYKITKYVGGNPLAIRVVGSALHGKSKEEWDSIEDNLEIIGGTQINNVLKISFDALENIEKKLFLDIACFFKGENEDFVKKILKACYSSVPFILRNLINKSLIKISNNKLQMHDLLQEMGRKIVYEESEDCPGKRSRLWHNDEIYNVLQNKEGTEVVESILLDMSRSKEIYLSSNAFVNMTNLRLLKLYWPPHYFEDRVNISKVFLPQGLDCLSNNLTYLRWDGYPLKTLPAKFNGEKLIALELPYSNIETLEGTKHVSGLIGCLKHTFSEGCKKLFKVPSSIQYFANLQFLDMRGCHNLRHFSRNMHFTSSITIDLTNCINLIKFPQISGNVKELCLAGTSIEEVPTSIISLSELVKLDMPNCTKLSSISTSICKLRSLCSLDLKQCLKLETFPEIMEEMKDFRELDLCGTSIKELPSSIENLTKLEDLWLENCKHLETIPSSIANLLYLKSLNANRSAISQLPSSIACWKKSARIYRLDLSHCNYTEFPEVVCSLSSLEELDLSTNNFNSVPESIKQLSELRYLNLGNCSLLQSIPELPFRVKVLCLNNCKQLESLPELPFNTEQVDDFTGHPNMYFYLSNCLNLTLNISLQRIQHMATALQLYYGKVLDKMPGFSFSFPGSEIPGWFYHQNFGSSITIELLQQYCCRRRLIGFALSAVVTFEKSYDGCDIIVDCKYSYANGDKKAHVGSFWGTIESDHIGIGFSPCMDVTLPEGQCTSITFMFYFRVRIAGRESCKLKCCGVCPIYEEHKMTLSSTSIERFASIHEDLKETTSVDCSKTSGSEDGRLSNEEVEPDPKRIHRN